MSTTLGSKDIEIRKVKFVTKTQFLYKKSTLYTNLQKRIVLCINLTQRKVSDDKPSKANSFEKKTNSFVNKSSKTNSSVDKFPKGLFPSVATSQMCNFPNVHFPK